MGPAARAYNRPMLTPMDLRQYARPPAGRAAPYLPVSRAEMATLGWEQCDIIIVTGDAYVDHPSFGMAIIGRVLEAQGLRVGIIAQPDWHSAEPFAPTRRTAAVLRHHRRQHGLDGQSLHLG
jgi:hypothetical protein